MANRLYFLCHDIRLYMSCSDSPCNSPQVSKDDRSDIESSSDEDNGPPPAPVQKHYNSTTNGTNKAHGTNGYLSAGAPCPDEHWPPLWDIYKHRSKAANTIHRYYMCACATWTTLPVWYWKCLIEICECSSVFCLIISMFPVSFYSLSLYLHQTALNEISKHSCWYSPLSV